MCINYHLLLCFSQLLETGLQVFPYPTEQSRIQSSTSVRLDEHSSTVALLPVGVTVALPDSILFLEDPQVARWDPIGEQFAPHIYDYCIHSYLCRVFYLMPVVGLCFLQVNTGGRTASLRQIMTQRPAASPFGWMHSMPSHYCKSLTLICLSSHGSWGLWAKTQHCSQSLELLLKSASPSRQEKALFKDM